MPRRRISQVPVSSEHSASSDQFDNLNETEELPDPGLPKTNSKDAKEKKKVSFDFPLEVIMKTGKYSGMGNMDLLDTIASLERSSIQKTQDGLMDVLSKFEFHQFGSRDKMLLNPKKNNEKAQKKVAVDNTSKKDTAKEAREVKSAKKREMEAKREAVKKAIEDEKRTKAEAEENNKIYKPGECLKYMTVEMHPSLASAWYMTDAVRELDNVGVRVASTDTICEVGLLVWTRRVPPTLANKAGQVSLISNQQYPRALYIMLTEQISSFTGEDAARLRELTAAPLTVLLLGANDYCKNKPRANFAQRIVREKFIKKVADLQIELMVGHQTDLVVVDSPSELASLLVHYTRAVAEAPYKIAKRDIDEQAEFYMRGDNKNCVTVDKDGNGVSRLWEQMIAVLPQSSLEVARTLGAEYKNPSELLQEFQNGGGISKIADIGVARTNVPGAKTRRLGPEFARKLHTLFTTEDGNTVIE